jgi:probable addiction module antidote protein
MKTSKKPNNTGKSIKKAKSSRSIDYEDYLLEELKDLEYAAGYLTACLDEGEDVFLLGIRDVAKAQGGMTALAKGTELNRESLYDMLSEDGNPRLKSLTKVVDSLGFKLEFKRKITGKNAA